MSGTEPVGSSSPTPALPDNPPASKNGIAAAPSAPVKGSPNDFLKKVIGKQVVVRLNSGVDYHGES